MPDARGYSRASHAAIDELHTVNLIYINSWPPKSPSLVVSLGIRKPSRVRTMGLATAQAD